MFCLWFGDDFGDDCPNTDDTDDDNDEDTPDTLLANAGWCDLFLEYRSLEKKKQFITK